MANLLIQTATDEMLARSIVNAISLTDIASLLSPETQARLAQIYPNGECWLWGLTPGPQNQRYWDRLQPGDETVFFAGGAIRFYMEVTYKEHNRELAEHVWGVRRHHRHGDNKIFELLYFSTKPQVFGRRYRRECGASILIYLICSSMAAIFVEIKSIAKDALRQVSHCLQV